MTVGGGAAAQNTGRCPHCKTACDDGDEFCGKCMRKLRDDRCASCGRTMKPSDLGCRSCGVPRTGADNIEGALKEGDKERAAAAPEPPRAVWEPRDMEGVIYGINGILQGLLARRGFDQYQVPRMAATGAPLMNKYAEELGEYKLEIHASMIWIPALIEAIAKPLDERKPKDEEPKKPDAPRAEEKTEAMPS